jgi:hypothetical protein
MLFGGRRTVPNGPAKALKLLFLALAAQFLAYARFGSIASF